jgi:hypothetical protein
MWTPPINESVELTREGPLVNSLLWGGGGGGGNKTPGKGGGWEGAVS